MHVPAEFLAAIVEQVGGLIWADPTNDNGEDDGGPAGALLPA
ncbi:MAG: hypothetical protein ACT4NY_00565 [Pseudonocardiales bacterium]